MMGFRVFAWLAALVVLALAGCESQPNAITDQIDGNSTNQSSLSMSKACGPRQMVGFTQYPRMTFGLLPESMGSALVWLSDDKLQIVITSLEIERRKYCGLSIDFNEALIISPIPFEQHALSPEEAHIFNRNINRCTNMGAVAGNMYSDVNDYFSTSEQAPISIGDGFVGCRRLVQNYTSGLIAESTSSSWRVFVSLDEILISKVR